MLSNVEFPGMPTIELGSYNKEKASRLKVASGNYPGHGLLPAPPLGARVGYSILVSGEWAGFVELTYPYDSTTRQVETTKSAYIGVGVLPKFRKLGLAEWAVKVMLKRHPEVRLWKWTFVKANTPSKKLGSKLGFGNMIPGDTFDTMIKRACTAVGV